MRTKSLPWLAVAGLLLALAWVPAPARAATLDVCPSGCTYASIQAALDASADGDVISVGPGSYTENLTVSTDVTIIGAGDGASTIDGGAAGSVITVPAGTIVSIEGVTITNGRADRGGGIFNEGTVSVSGVVIDTNVAVVSGGGIWNNGGSVTVSGSTLSNGSSMLNGTGGFLGGGGIATLDGVVAVSNSTITANTAVDPGTDQRGGGGIAASRSDVTITDSIVSDNTSGFSSGGIYITASGSELVVTRTTVSGNRTGLVRGTGRGGGISVRSAASATIVDSTISGNSSASSGGGIHTETSIDIRNTTISGNTATSTGGGIASDSTVNLDSVTIANNSAEFGGGIDAIGETIVATNSVIADNSGTTGVECRGTVSVGAGDVGFLETPDAQCTTSGGGTITTGVDPLLGPLADNGGPTLTQAPAAGSPLVDAGATDLASDQRGQPRPYVVDDIGAVEVQAAPPSIVVSISADPTGGEAPLDVEWTVTLTNDGGEDLTDPSVALSSDGGTTAFATLEAPPDSGDIGGDGVLDVGESWSWLVNTTETVPITVTVTGAATDSSAGTITWPDDPEARDSATVDAADTTPPTWTVPDDITVPAEDDDGALVDYTASATDAVGVTDESCEPPTGSRFPIGATDVTCTASDAAGNTAVATFTVTVTAPPTTTTSTTTTPTTTTPTTTTPTTTTTVASDDTLPNTGFENEGLGLAGGAVILIGSALVAGASLVGRRRGEGE